MPDIEQLAKEVRAEVEKLGSIPKELENIKKGFEEVKKLVDEKSNDPKSLISLQQTLLHVRKLLILNLQSLKKQLMTEWIKSKLLQKDMGKVFQKISVLKKKIFVNLTL